MALFYPDLPLHTGSEQYDVQGEQVGDEKRGALKRRGLIAGAAALVAGVLAKQAAEPVAATAADGDVVGGTSNAYGTTTAVILSPHSQTAPALNGNNGYTGALDRKGDGIQGYSTNPDPTLSNAGVFGRVNDLNGVGIFGDGPNGTGAFGESASGSGVAGSSITGTGVYGISASGEGVYGQSTSGIGVHGLSNGSYGMLGITTAGGPFSGITGGAQSDGAAAFAGGTSNPRAYGAYFTGSVVVQGPFTVVDPTQKHGAIKAPDGQHHILYSVESPESWLEDFGTANFANGTVNVNLNADFASVVHTSDYHVFLTEVDGHHHLTVHNKTATGFTVQADPEIAALKGKATASLNGSVAWRVVAKPKSDLTAERFAKFDLPNIKIPGVNADLPKVKPTLPTLRPKK